MSPNLLLTLSVLFSLFTLCLSTEYVLSPSSIDQVQNAHEWMQHIVLTDDLPSNVSNKNTSENDVITICKAYLTEYALQSSSFTKCLVENARPFRFCEGCVQFYKKASTVFSDMTADQACSKEILLADRVQVVRLVNSNMEDIWQSAYCNDCFFAISENTTSGDVEYTLKNTTKEFLHLFLNVTKCLNNTIQYWDPEMIIKGNNSYCYKCRTHYRSLNDFFTSVIQKGGSEVCMDVVDMMNYTRLMWSKSLSCSHRTGDIVPILIITSVICALPVIFYVANRLLHSRVERTIVIQRRMKIPRTNTYDSTIGSQHSLGNNSLLAPGACSTPVITTTND